MKVFLHLLTKCSIDTTTANPRHLCLSVVKNVTRLIRKCIIETHRLMLILLTLHYAAMKSSFST